MKYVKLGNTGTDVSKICLGMMSFGKPGISVFEHRDPAVVKRLSEVRGSTGAA